MVVSSGKRSGFFQSRSHYRLLLAIFAVSLKTWSRDQRDKNGIGLCVSGLFYFGSLSGPVLLHLTCFVRTARYPLQGDDECNPPPWYIQPDTSVDSFEYGVRHFGVDHREDDLFFRLYGNPQKALLFVDPCSASVQDCASLGTCFPGYPDHFVSSAFAYNGYNKFFTLFTYHVYTPPLFGIRHPGAVSR